MIQTAEELAGAHGVTAACAALSVPRSSLYRARPATNVPEAPAPGPEPASRPAPPRALSPTEQAQVREVLNSERFQDLAPREVYAELLDEARYVWAVSTVAGFTMNPSLVAVLSAVASAVAIAVEVRGKGTSPGSPVA